MSALVAEPVTGDASSVDADADASSDPDGDAPPDGPTRPPDEPDGACLAGPSPGDLVIDELMIASVAGSGDYGEWLEVRSARTCALNLRGLHGDCPRGAKVRTLDVLDDVWVPALGTFVIADSLSSAVNHDLPGIVLTWAGQPGDVLRNEGATVSLRVHDALIDTVTYPSLKPSPGASLAFPDDCPPSRRSEWSAWQTSRAPWFPGFLGSPNAPNRDVGCP